jgi:hypothetical protein
MAANYDDQNMHTVPVQQTDPAQPYGQPAYGAQAATPQYVGGQPATSYAQPVPTQQNAGAVGCNTASFKRVVTSPDGILRLLEWLLTVISFACMADLKGYSTYSEFEFLVAAGVLAWLWTMVMLTCYIFDFHSTKPVLNLVEFVGDLLWAFFEFVAGVASAARCNKTFEIPILNISQKTCEGVDKPKAAAAFAFLACFALLGSAFFSFKKWRSSK